MIKKIKLKKKDVFTGNIMKCINYNRYIIDGNESNMHEVFYSGELLKNKKIKISNTKIIKEKVLLIRVDKNVFSYFGNEDLSVIKNLFFSPFAYKYLLFTYPSQDNLNYIDYNSVEPLYSKEEQEETISLKKLIRK